MAHVVTEKCDGCKFTDCVEVCPVTCFYELDNQVVIHPDECIDCTACVEVCPVHAIYAEGDLPPEFTKHTEFNATQASRSKIRVGSRSQPAKSHCPVPWSGKRRWVINPFRSRNQV